MSFVCLAGVLVASPCGPRDRIATFAQRSVWWCGWRAAHRPCPVAWAPHTFCLPPCCRWFPLRCRGELTRLAGGSTHSPCRWSRHHPTTHGMLHCLKNHARCGPSACACCVVPIAQCMFYAQHHAENGLAGGRVARCQGGSACGVEIVQGARCGDGPRCNAWLLCADCLCRSAAAVSQGQGHCGESVRLPSAALLSVSADACRTSYKSIKEDLGRSMQSWQEALSKARASEARTAVTGELCVCV